MTVSNDLTKIASRLAQRSTNRSEATIQSDVRQFLLTAPFELDDDQLDAPLEVPVGDGRRIDVEIGLTVIEIKRDIRKPSIKAAAIKQLAGYVGTRSSDLGQRYTGVLTDGCDWIAYHLVESGELQEVSSYELDKNSSSLDDFVVWLEGFLATAQEILPTPAEIDKRLGAKSSAHALDKATISALYEQYADLPTVSVKRELWAKLLRTALGTQFPDDDELFVEHTLLVVSAEIIAHAVVGFDLHEINPASLVVGELFAQAQIQGVVEADFFDWVIEVPTGDRFVRSLAKRLARFSWAEAEHDVMKTLYESIIEAEQRKSLGEYYTPDWLASSVVENAVENPSTDTVLDPACGSGTFLFHAIRRHLKAQDSNDVPLQDQVESVTQHVFGIDIHPVAVTLARVTYLLAIGNERLQHPERPPIAIPVFLGDTVQWNAREDIFSYQTLVVPTTDKKGLFPEELRFPDSLLDDSRKFDRLVTELSQRVQDRKQGTSPPSLSAVFRRFAIKESEKKILTETFNLMCSLHDQGRNHIWGYYVRNVARPMWLSRPENRVDVLLGNPPWLSFRFMPAEMQSAFQEMSQERGLWQGAAVATNQDLSCLFVARSSQLYLRKGGRFGFVLPEAVLSRKQYKGFRNGHYDSTREPVDLKFHRPWSLHAVKPAFFPVPACAVFGERTANEPTPLNLQPEKWAGRLPNNSSTWAEAKPHITREVVSTANPEAEYASLYRERFRQGASVVPRLLFVVERKQAGPLGAGVGLLPVKSERSPQEKSPWKNLQGNEGAIEAQFIRLLLTGQSVIPFKLRDPLSIVIPWDGKQLLEGSDDTIDLYPGLAKWWRQGEETWLANRSSDRLSLKQQLNYQGKLTDQFGQTGARVVYSGSGMYLVAAVVEDPRMIIDTKLYWSAISSKEEGQFLVGVLNAPITTEMVRPHQSRGEHNPRDFHKHVWKLPIPIYDPSCSDHVRVARLSEGLEDYVNKLQLPENVRFEAIRRFVRREIEQSELGREINSLVKSILERNVS